MGWPVKSGLIPKISLIDCSRKTLLILDKEGRIIAALVGQPDDPEWRYVIDDATNIMQEVQQLGTAVDLFSDSSLDHRRGEFLAIPVGVSFGGGQMVRASPGLYEGSLRFLSVKLTPGTGESRPHSSHAPTYPKNHPITQYSTNSRVSIK